DRAIEMHEYGIGPSIRHVVASGTFRTTRRSILSTRRSTDYLAPCQLFGISGLHVWTPALGLETDRPTPGLHPCARSDSTIVLLATCGLASPRAAGRRSRSAAVAAYRSIRSIRRPCP